MVRFKTASILFVVMLSVLVIVFWWLTQHGFSARDQPAAIEIWIARRLRHLAVPANQRSAQNPVPPSPDILAEARGHFADHCAICHANDGSGQTPIGRNVYPKAPDLRAAETQRMSDGELFYTIHNGIRFTGMPAWGKGRPEDDLESWKLVHFLRHLPHITEEELEVMRTLNPKSLKERQQEAEFERFLEGDETKDTPSPHH
ncbi:c-type cytochrome [Nitrospira sp. Nam74]